MFMNKAFSVQMAHTLILPHHHSMKIIDQHSMKMWVIVIIIMCESNMHSELQVAQHAQVHVVI